ncbi:MAG: ATP-dependent RNA helicase HrpA [Planctomycetes bacterium]|nr:ATP-dependent RNA helicase HrpA [Planctomycetota bacterium]
MAQKALDRLAQQIDQCLFSDRARLVETQHGIERALRNRRMVDQRLRRFADDVHESMGRRQSRVNKRPAVEYPELLPVAAKRGEIAAAIKAHQVVVICGETGSGKTTQVPKICLEAGRGIDGMIGHTQPRRIAASSISSRLAFELKCSGSKAVGYKIRFTDKTSPNTYIKVMTDGILLAETQGDRMLQQYDTIIIDEAHERSLNIDFLLGFLKGLLPQRPDLKVIIMSATIDPERFSAHFDEAPIIEVSGRVYPVEVRHRPLIAEDEDERDRTMHEAILEATGEAALLGTGDVLVFLSGERDIRETAAMLRKHHPPGTEILPLYSRLSTAEQNKVFQKHEGRRIILATNVAETSLTVPGIRYVVDPGLARISRYSPHTRIQRLPIEPVSQASADQRKGRCGRVEAGVCFRLFSEQEYEARPAYTDPEILRTSLAGVILQMAALKLGDVEKFPFMDPPDPRAIRDGYQTLWELGALDDHNAITEIGRKLSRLPIDPRLGRILLAADEESCLREVTIIAAALSIQDPRQRPLEMAEKADAAHAEFADSTSDFVALLNLWHEWHTQSRELSGSQLRKWCRDHFVSFVRMREWQDVLNQLRTLLTQMKFKANTKEASYPLIHRALLTGLVNNVGHRGDESEYNGTRSITFNIFPGSGLFRTRPSWLMCAELVRTTKLYARTVARIQPEWIEAVAPHLLKHTYSEPHWDRKSAHVNAYEKLLLRGLEVVPKRRVHYGPINPAEAREVFIYHALAVGEYDGSNAPYAQHNRALEAQIEAMEAKVRHRGLMADASMKYAFFEPLIPQGIHNGPDFEKWRRQAERENPRLLFMELHHLLGGDPSAITDDRYPDEIVVNNNRLRLTYELAPGKAGDGVTVVVPIELLGQFDEDRLDWLIPGWLEEKVMGMIKGLPKSLRTVFMPAKEYAAWFVANVEYGRGRLVDALSEQLGHKAHVEVPADAWSQDALEPYLRMKIRVVDRKGRSLARGEDPGKIRARLRGETEQAMRDMGAKKYRQKGLTAWTIEPLPRDIAIAKRDLSLAAYPGLVDNGRSVSVQLFSSAEAAAASHRGGVRRLGMLALNNELADQARNLPGFHAMSLQYVSLGTADELRRELIVYAADLAFFGNDEPEKVAAAIRSKGDFDRMVADGATRLHTTVGRACTMTARILDVYQQVDLKLSEEMPSAWEHALDEIERQLGYLLCQSFLVSVPSQWLEQFPRYLSGILARIEKLGKKGPSNDARLMADLSPMWQWCQKQRAHLLSQQRVDGPLEYFRWMIEEMRISIFAQELGTMVPVSFKRLNEHWQRLRESSAG